MKKFYCALAAAAMTLTANAADYYMIGGFNNWALKDAKAKFVEGSTAGEYVLDYDGTLSTGFKINDGTWSNDAINFGSNGSKLEVGVPYTLGVGGSTGNIDIAGNIQNPKLVLNVSDPTAPTLLIKGEETEATFSYVLWGSFEGTDWTGIDLKAENGKYTATATVIDCEFGIKEMNDATGGQARWLSSAGDAAVTVGTAMPLKVEGTNFSLAAGTYVFTLDVDAMTLLVSEEGDVPTPPTPPVGEYKELNLVGAFNGWDPAEGPKFTREGNVYTLVLEDGLTGEWKICDGSWAYSFGGACEVPDGVEVNAWFNGDNFSSAFSGKTTIVFTLVEGSDVAESPIPSKLVATAEGVVEIDPVEKWYVSIQGDFNDWKGEGVNPSAEGVVEFKDVQIGTSSFKVKVWNGVADAWHSNGEAIALNTPTEIPGNSDINMTIAGAEADQYFDITYNALTSTLTVNTASGISTVAAENGEAIYFNLQGMKVENPVNGIFVKVANGKAVKVVK